ncbi:hypothetical protein NC652_039914 [Populus alba x Populus x berolinensis]|nr:hypothetical protein NC652_039914 [Populus alba x Populus x berolinensis]
MHSVFASFEDNPFLLKGLGNLRWDLDCFAGKGRGVGEGGMQFILGFRFEPLSFERTLQQKNNKQSRLRQRARLERYHLQKKRVGYFMY